MDHAKLVLGAVVSTKRRDFLLYAAQHLTEDHFRVEAERNLFVLLNRFWDIAADILPKATLEDLLRRESVDVSKRVYYTELYTTLEDMRVAEADFRYSVNALRDQRAEQLTAEAITAAFEVMEKGVDQQGVLLKGHTDARAFLYQELGRIDRLGNEESAPEGFIRQEGRDILQEYADRKSKPAEALGIMTGIPSIDNITSGYQPGELILYCGYTGTGKSMLAAQTAWNACVMQGKNVFFATTETIRNTVRRRILARHSRLPQFEIPGGFNTRDIKNASLTEAQEKKFAEVVDDYTNNPAYGDIYLAQVPRGATLGYLESRLSHKNANWQVDLVVMDYLALLKSDYRRDNRVAEFSDLLIESKQIAATFDRGRGIPFISPWAMQQNAYKDALRTGEYTLASLSDTSEAEKSADQITTLLKLPDMVNEVKMQFLKNRDGETPPPFLVETDFRASYVGGKKSGAADLLSVGLS